MYRRTRHLANEHSPAGGETQAELLSVLMTEDFLDEVVYKKLLTA